MQQISRMLMKLFQRTSLEKPGKVDPRAAEFTLNLLVAMYDRSGTGYVKARSAAAALISLSGDTLLTKYRDGKSFFHFYAVPDGKATLITRSALRSLLTDLNQILTIVGEGCTLSCVEIAIHDCFHGVLNAAIVEEKFLSWLRSEPAVLLWLPTCYRLSVMEMVSHQARCR
ncbi:DYTN protein, partial [Drymodes brunneopygia]|nr:DYTN protein [Drymodes brunneopygia]